MKGIHQCFFRLFSSGNRGQISSNKVYAFYGVEELFPSCPVCVYFVCVHVMHIFWGDIHSSVWNPNLNLIQSNLQVEVAFSEEWKNMSLYLKLVLAEMGDLQQACSRSVIPRCVCVSLVMVWRIMSPVCCVTQISFYRSAHSRRNTHITPHTYHPVLLLLTLADTLSSPHTYSPLTCFSFQTWRKRKPQGRLFSFFEISTNTQPSLC